MDILTHTVSGLAAGSVLANMTPADVPVCKKWRIMIAGAVGGAFPDMDAISLWSRFDATIGRWFGLEHSGSVIYSGKFWYSHHAFFHSVVAALAVGWLAVCLPSVLRRMTRRKTSFGLFPKSCKPVYFGFVAGWLAHLLGDCITPASTWGGVRMFWPLPVYVGGWGNVWWWNNYDLFLIITLCFLLNLAWMTATAPSGKRRIRAVPAAIALITFLWLAVQVKSRQTDYAYEGHATRYRQLEEASKKEQQRILGTGMYRWMEKLDNKLPFYF
ncbi:MAG: metal-dependent hydrolase [Bacteroidales bacterium]|jgi:hypothetical protein|nr:metal-dependent hydrolase [Bacteroidales bacterium]